MEEQIRTAVKVSDFLPLKGNVVLKATAVATAFQLYLDEDEIAKKEKEGRDVRIKYTKSIIVGYAGDCKNVELGKQVALENPNQIRRIQIKGNDLSYDKVRSTVKEMPGDSPEVREQKRLKYQEESRTGTTYEIIDYFLTPEYNIMGMHDVD